MVMAAISLMGTSRKEKKTVQNSGIFGENP